MIRQLTFLSLLALVGSAACGKGLVDAKGMPWVRYIDQGGGRLESQDGRFVFQFPAGALDEGYSLEIDQKTPAPDRYAGVVYELRRLDGSGEIELRKPATVTLRFVDTPEYLEPPRLGRVAKGDVWKPMAFTREGDRLVASVTRTGTFGAWDGCTTDDGCGGALICEDGACVPPACRDASGCGELQDCAAGRCVDRCPGAVCTPGATCGTDSTCKIVDGCPACVPLCEPVKEVCDNGVDDDCDKAIDEADDDCAMPGCRSNTGCPRDTYCVDGLCVACRDNNDCPWDQGYVCTDRHTCEMEGCTSDQECPAFSGCYLWDDGSGTLQGMCYACPGPGTQHYCVDDLACGRGTICEGWGNGCRWCQPAQCTYSADCPGDEQCFGGRCVSSACVDRDGDMYPGQEGCGAPVDCDDGDAQVRPGHPERCNGRDDNCDGAIDVAPATELCPFGGTCENGRCL